MAVRIEDEIFYVLACEHAKLARGSGFARVRLKNLKTQTITEKTLRDSDTIEEIEVEKRLIQFLYRQDIHFHFIDLTNYEDLVFDEDRIADHSVWLKENQELLGLFHENSLISFEIPVTLELKVADTDPGYKGDSVRAGLKPAILETGVTIQVPLFVNKGDVIKVDTQKKEYIARVSS